MRQVNYISEELIFSGSSKPANPSLNYIKRYKRDGKFYELDDTGTEKRIIYAEDVTDEPLTGLTPLTGTITATDTILEAFGKISSALSSSAFLQGGNSFGAEAVLGTKDFFDLSIIRNNIKKVTFFEDDLSPIGNYSLGKLANPFLNIYGTNLYGTSLTANRIPYTGTNGQILTTNNLTFNPSTNRATIGHGNAPDGTLDVRNIGTAGKFSKFVMGNDNTGLGDSFFNAMSHIGRIFGVNSFGGGTNLIAHLGINYAISSANGTAKYAVIGAKKAPIIELNAETGQIKFYGENGTGGDYRTPVHNLGLTVNANGSVSITSPSIGGFTQGSVIFAGPSAITQDNVNFFWNNTDKRLGIRTNTPQASLDVRGAGTTSATWTAQFHNSTGTNNALMIRDDGRVIFGSNTFTSTAAPYEFHGVISQVLPGNTTTIQFNRYPQTTATTSVIIGVESAQNVTGGSIVAIGMRAAQLNTSGSGFTAIGSNAARNGSSATNFVAVGFNAARATPGRSFVAVGQDTGMYNENSEGEFISLGYRSAYLAVGGGFATNFRTGIYIGTDTKVSHPTNLISNEIVIGYRGEGLGSNTTSIGNVSTTHTNLFGNLTLGTTTNTSGRLQAWGSGSTSATWTAQFHNSTGTNNAFLIRDDGWKGLGLSSPFWSTADNGFEVRSGANAVHGLGTTAGTYNLVLAAGLSSTSRITLTNGSNVNNGFSFRFNGNANPVTLTLNDEVIGNLVTWYKGGKTLNSATYTATENNDYGWNFTGTLTGTATPSDTLNGVLINPILIAGANSQTLEGLRVNPSFTTGIYTGLTYRTIDSRANIDSSLVLRHTNTSSGTLAKTIFTIANDANQFVDFNILSSNHINSGYLNANRAIFRSTLPNGLYIGVDSTNVLARMVFFVGNGLGSTEVMYMDANRNVSIGTPILNARFTTVGAGTTSATWTAQFHNSTGINNALMIRDDGKVLFNTSVIDPSPSPSDIVFGNGSIAADYFLSINNGNANRNGIRFKNGILGSEISHSSSNDLVLSRLAPNPMDYITLGGGRSIFNSVTTAPSNHQYGWNFTGTLTARATASDTLNGVLINPTLVASENTQSLNAVTINPTFNTGAFTGSSRTALTVTGVFGTSQIGTTNSSHNVVFTGNASGNIPGSNVSSFIQNASTTAYGIVAVNLNDTGIRAFTITKIGTATVGTNWSLASNIYNGSGVVNSVNLFTHSLVNITAGSETHEFTISQKEAGTIQTPFSVYGRNIGIGRSGSAHNARLHLVGVGTTSATTAFLVQNSSFTNLFAIRDDGSAVLRTSSNAVLINGTASTSRVIAIGTNSNFASGAGVGGIAIGESASAGGLLSLALGSDSSSSLDFSIAIGYQATSLHIGSIVLGHGSRSTGTNSFVSGSNVNVISDVYFGSGVQRNSTNGAGANYTINGSGGFSANQAGGNLTLAGGKPTGSGAAGDVIFATSTAGVSGSILQSLTDRWWVKGNTGFLGNVVTPLAMFHNKGIGTSDSTINTLLTDSNGDYIAQFKDDRTTWLRNVQVESTDSFCFGDIDTDGTWRMIRNGTDLEVQLRVAGVFITKGIFTP